MPFYHRPTQRDDESPEEYQERLSCYIDGLSDYELMKYVEQSNELKAQSEDDYYPSDAYCDDY